MDGARFAPGAARLAGLAGMLAGWSADAFWRATPAELRPVLEAIAPGGEAPVGPAELGRLMEMFPD